MGDGIRNYFKSTNVAKKDILKGQAVKSYPAALGVGPVSSIADNIYGFATRSFARNDTCEVFRPNGEAYALAAVDIVKGTTVSINSTGKLVAHEFGAGSCGVSLDDIAADKIGPILFNFEIDRRLAPVIFRTNVVAGQGVTMHSSRDEVNAVSNVTDNVTGFALSKYPANSSGYIFVPSYAVYALAATGNLAVGDTVIVNATGKLTKEIRTKKNVLGETLEAIAAGKIGRFSFDRHQLD